MRRTTPSCTWGDRHPVHRPCKASCVVADGAPKLLSVKFMNNAAARKIQTAWRATRWIPTDAEFQKPYAKLNYFNTLNIVPNSGTKNQRFRNAVAANRQNGAIIGPASTFGTVKKIAGPYVKKTMLILSRGKSTDYLKVALNEIRVGGLPGVFPRVHAWRVQRDLGGEIKSVEYIMDDFTVAPPGFKVISMKDYGAMLGACPTPDHPLYDILKRAVTKFWRLTQGYHGDLHVGNMAVMYSETTKLPVKVIIFDYGSHKKFKARLGNSACFEDYLSVIDREFTARYKKPTLNSRNIFPQHSKIRLAYGKRGQGRRSNANIFREMTAQGAINASRSMMTGMHPTNKTLVAKQKLQAARPRLSTTMIKYFRQMYPNRSFTTVRRGLRLKDPNYGPNKVPVRRNTYNAMMVNVQKMTPLITSSRNAFVKHMKNVHPTLNNATIEALVNAHHGPVTRRRKRTRGDTSGASKKISGNFKCVGEGLLILWPRTI